MVGRTSAKKRAKQEDRPRREKYMKKIILSLGYLLFILFFYSKDAFAQLEITTGYATNRNYADGIPLHIAYDFKLTNKLFTKSQIGFKYLYHFNDFVGATMKVTIWEFHQTISYELIKKKKYILKPNIGLNYRFYKWQAEMVEPLNTLPGRALVIGVRNGNFSISSKTGDSYKEYTPNNAGFSFQIQNQFRLNDKLWLHITPFLEPDYDRSQNTGGCYIGLIFKKM